MKCRFAHGSGCCSLKQTLKVHEETSRRFSFLTVLFTVTVTSEGHDGTSSSDLALPRLKFNFPVKSPHSGATWVFFMLQAQVLRRFVSFRWQDALKEVLIRFRKRLHWFVCSSPPSPITRHFHVMWRVVHGKPLLPRRCIALLKSFKDTWQTLKCDPLWKKPSQSHFASFSLSVMLSILSYIIQALKELIRHSAVTK